MDKQAAAMADRQQAGQQSWEGEMFRLLVENVTDTRNVVPAAPHVHRI